MDLHYNFPNREEIEVLKESKLLSQVIWSYNLVENLITSAPKLHPVSVSHLCFFQIYLHDQLNVYLVSP